MHDRDVPVSRDAEARDPCASSARLLDLEWTLSRRNPATWPVLVLGACALVFSRPRLLVAVAMAMLPAMLGWAVVVGLVPVSQGLGGWEPIRLGGRPFWLQTAGLVLLGANSLFAAAVAVLQAAAAMAGGDPGAWQTVKLALHRAPMLLRFAGCWLVVIGQFAYALVLPFALLADDAPQMDFTREFCLAVACVVALFAWSVGCLVWTVALVEDRPLVSSLRWARHAIGGSAWRRIAGTSLLAVVLPVAAVGGYRLATDGMRASSSPWVAALSLYLPAALLWLVALAVCGAVLVAQVAAASGRTLGFVAGAGDGRLTVVGPAGARQGTPGRRRRAHLRWLTLPAWLLPPVMLAAVLMWWTSSAVPQYTYDELEFSGDPILRADGRPLFASGIGAVVCEDQRCERSFSVTSHHDKGEWKGYWSGTSVTAAGPRLIASGWMDGKLLLASCEITDCRHDNSLAVLDRDPNYDEDSDNSDWLTSAVSARSGSIVVASVRPARKPGRAALALHRCADRRCTEPQRIRLDERVGLDRMVGEEREFPVEVELALTTDGRPVIALMDQWDGQLWLLICDTARCENPVQRQLAPQPDPRRFWPLTGIAMELSSDDRPVLAYQHNETAVAMLAVCTDPRCRQVSKRTLGGEVFPDIALDRSDRPFAVVHDSARRRTALVVCANRACSSSSRRYLATERMLKAAAPYHLGVALDPADRPVVTRYFGPIDWRVDGESPEFGDLIRCRYPRCASGPLW